MEGSFRPKPRVSCQRDLSSEPGLARFVATGTAYKSRSRRIRREQRGSSVKDLKTPDEDNDAIDLAVDPDVLPAEPTSKVGSSVLSPAAEENPASAHSAPRDSG